jgi:hypothetical protein
MATCVVDQNIHWPKLLHDLFSHLRDRLAITHIRNECDCLTARLPDEHRRFSKLFFRTCHYCNAGSRRSQGLSNRSANATSSASDHCHLTREEFLLILSIH